MDNAFASRRVSLDQLREGRQVEVVHTPFLGSKELDISGSHKNQQRSLRNSEQQPQQSQDEIFMTEQIILSPDYKRDVQMTPNNPNLINYINSSRFETPIHSN